ncbi:unnamed protein product, partial [Laminaria digitata]
GKYAEAEPLYTRALDITEKALGPEHPSTGVSLSNLAELFEAQVRAVIPPCQFLGQVRYLKVYVSDVIII